MKRVLLGIGLAALGAAVVAACSGDSPKTFEHQVEKAQHGDARSGALTINGTTIYGGQNVLCQNLEQGAWSVRSITGCRLQAGDSTEATIRIPLDLASQAGLTRVVYLCDYTKVREVVTFRREMNWAWETITREHSDNPQCSTGRHLKLQYDPVNDYYRYDVEHLNPFARNHDVVIRIPGCREAYTWQCPFYRNPSIYITVADYDPATVTQSTVP